MEFRTHLGEDLITRFTRLLVNFSFGWEVIFGAIRNICWIPTSCLNPCVQSQIRFHKPPFNERACSPLPPLVQEAPPAFLKRG